MLDAGSIQQLCLTKFNNPIIVYHKRRKEASDDLDEVVGKSESQVTFWGPEVVRPQHPRVPRPHHPLSLKGPSLVGALAPSFTFHRVSY
jgi:hypothetical protein